MAEPMRALGAETVCEAFQLTVADHPDLTALRMPGGEWELSWSEYGERVRRTAAGLSALGVGAGDVVATMLTNRPEFHWVDTAAMHLGAIGVSIYNTFPVTQVEHLLRDCECGTVVTESQFLPAILSARQGAPALRQVIVVDGDGSEGMTLEELEGLGRPGFPFEETWRSVGADDVLTLIYTSGTTGPPKGVQLTHRNMMSMVRMWEEFVPTPGPGARIPSYLPMAHVAEREFSHYQAIPRAATVTTIADHNQIIAALPDVRPTAFLAVPRVWEKLKAGLEAGFGAAPAEERERFERAVAAGVSRVRLELAGDPVDPELAAETEADEEQVFAPLRAALGFDQLEGAIAGAAPTPPEVLEFFFAIGIPIYEVWGMSETSALVTANPLERPKIGTVGVPLPGAEVRLAEDGEVLVRAPNVMLGYLNAPAETERAIDPDGWLRTGDIGELDDEGYLRIVDRKKELIINAAGKNMSPTNIEARIRSASPLIAQAVAIGDRRPYNVALVTLEPDALAGRDEDDPALREEILDAVARANEQLARVEQIKRVKVLPGEWLPGGDELTPTLKPKRKVIAEKYSAEIEELYEADS
ncbi:MAG: long-chain fatty acid--CoA ligase [Solirubrobacterales bacterium]|nr:long-chain fatty acid--CoA ligase [Solirubrobacterales bacterium]